MTSNRFGLNRTLGFAIFAIALVSLLGSLLMLVSQSQLQRATARRYRSHLSILALDAFQVAMLDQETGLRGYLLTGLPTSLQPYTTGRPALDAAIDELDGLMAASPDQLASLHVAEQAARHWQASIAEQAIQRMADPATRDEARRIESSGVGKAAFDAFRARLEDVTRNEKVIFAGQDAVVRHANLLATLVIWLSAALTLTICLSVGIALNRLVTRPLIALADAMRRLVLRDTAVEVPSIGQRNEVGEMARAVAVFKDSLIELDRTSMLRVTADTLPAMVGYVGADRKIGFLNDEFSRWFALGAQDVAQMQGTQVERAFPRGSFPGAGDELGRALAGEDVRFALQLESKAGARHDMEAYFRPHRAPDGRILGAVTLLTDVTDRKDIDRRLRHQAHDLQRSNEELEQFAYVASHDLKAPLRGIENLASWIEEDLGAALAGDARTNMNLLKSRVGRLESLLNDLLAYSRAGRADTVVSTIDTGAMVAELAELLSPPEGFVIEGAPGLPRLQAVKAALMQVLQNLIGNAIKHHPAPARGHVWVDASLVGKAYEFRVADDGPGVPEQFRDRVFGMFQTLRPRDEVEGSGMGLAIVRKLVERQAGKVWLTARQGGGLVVHFTWPATPGAL